jgi:hypothetical protein
MKLTSLIIIGLCLLASASRTPAQVLPSPPSGDSDQNRHLRIQLDRVTVRAFEPVFLCLTADQFAAGSEVEVQVRRGAEPWRPVVIAKKDWDKTEIPVPGSVPTQRRGAIIQAEEINGNRRYVFPDPGDYKIRVKIGPDSTTLNLTVTPPEPGEQQAWDTLQERVNDVLQNNFADQPEQGTVDICAKIIRKYPKSMAAAYCQSYISITKFKLLFEKHAKGGGKTVYADVAEELNKISSAFHDSFFGEMTSFYAAYAKGLAKEFQSVLAIADAMNTHLTIWGDAVVAMKYEVLAHIAPQVIDPTQPPPPPTTAPAATSGQAGAGAGSKL